MHVYISSYPQKVNKSIMQVCNNLYIVEKCFGMGFSGIMEEDYRMQHNAIPQNESYMRNK